MTSGQLHPDRELIIGVTPGARPDGRLVVGLCRAGALGVLDAGRDPERARAEMRLVAVRHDGPFGVRLDRTSALDAGDLPPAVDVVVTPSVDLVGTHRAAGRRVLAEVTTLAEARSALAAGADGLVAKGAEAGGRVGEETAFVLLQRLVAAVDAPVWLQGGIGLDTAAAAVAGGARGVVLDAQLALARDATLPPDVRAAVAAMDGSETVVVGRHRVFTRPDLALPAADAPPDEIAGRLGADDLRTQLLPIGQDGSFARPLADRYKTAGGIVQAARAAIADHLAVARELRPLAPGGGTAATRGTALPIAQGPMTRVSDRAGFAAAVAGGGALPFLALSLMRGDEIRALLADTAEAVADRPWGVGILGFVPPELRDEQLAVVREARPPVALIAGGRPSQAAPLEAEGITTFLHVPSPGLLDRFWKDGARRFVFEGRECGGHVGPRSSFALWQRQIDRLLQEGDLAGVEVFFAGGIHDARSSAMVAAMAAPLAERGAAVGVLMGTAYVMTAEAVETGAITQTFLDEAVACDDTVLLETSPGHATRCVASEYVAAFERRKAELVAAGTDVREMWTELEGLNLGRLRIASKGLVRVGDELTHVDDEARRREGMFMIGQVAALRDAPTTIADLHRDVTEGAAALLDGLAGPETVDPRGAAGTGSIGIAVVGTAALFPGAVGVDQFWANVVGGVDGISEVPAHRWSVERYYDPDAVVRNAGAKTPSKWGGFLPDVPFDPMRYGIPPRSITSIGNDQLLSLEVAAAALADAGYADRPFDRERTSVVFGAETGTDLAQAYGFRSALPHFVGEVPEALDAIPALTEDSFPGVLANVIAGRIANRLDLGGANYTVDAACGASMAALSAACHELTSGSSDMVLCGGTDLHNGIYDYLLFAATHALSPTGRCRTFDAAADGISLGEGVGCIVLKRLADAERDGDRILAVIDGVAASSDGRSLGLTAPRREGQRRALERAYDRSGVSPAAVGLVEAHGTGTVVGDRTELTTLTDVYSERGAVPGSTTLGSVKSQIGHTKCAAGIAGVIKAVHALHRGVLPPTLNIAEPNEAYDAKTSPFVFREAARPWVGDDRRAAVSAFGFGGSNFHAVLSAYGRGDQPAHGLDQWPAELFLVRAASPADAEAELDRLAGLAAANESAGRPWRLRDLARTVHERRRGPVQVAIVADDLDDLTAKVARARAGETGRGVFRAPATADAETPPQVAFLYPGQGSQRPHMLADLFVGFPALRRWLDLADPELVDRIFPPAGHGEAAGQAAAALTDTRTAQPALGLAGLAMTALLGECGVAPDAAGGHSYGELPALVAAGAIDPRDLVALSRARGDAIVEASPDDDPGAMAAVRGPVAEVQDALDPWPDVIVANDNAPDQCVVSGPTDQVTDALARLAELGFGARRLPVACAFHTPRLAMAAEALAAHLDGIDVGVPSFPVWSNTTAAPYGGTADEVRSSLAGQVAAPVAFRRQVEAMYEAGARVFVESGPGRVLTQLVGKILGDRPHVAVACDVPGDHGIRRFLLALAELAAHGVPVDASVLFDGRDAAVVDPAAPPARAPYLLDGSRVRTADGERVPGSLPPAHDFPPISLAAAPPAVGGDDPQALVAEYLRGMQQIVAAERDVVLAALGAPPSTTTGPAVQAPVIEASAVVAAPGAPVGAAALASPASASVAVAPEALLETIVAIVSERTGYPVEMLDPDLDLEAELSIDSIKRIEILGELAERVGLPGMDESGVDESVIEELALIKTLRGIVDWVDEHRDDAALVPAPPAGAAAAGAGPAAGPPVLAPEALLETIVAIVSERTGYPVEMLDPDLDLEAELSIDSIKRIEILGELAERVGLPGMDESGVDESVIEELALIKTLRGIVDWVEDHRDLAPGAGATVGGAASGAGEVVASGAGVGEHAGPASPTAGAAGPGSGGHAPGPAPSPLARYVPALVEAPPGDDAHDLSGTAVVVVDGGTEVGGRLHDLLAGAGAAVSLIAPEDAAGALGAEGAGEPHTLVDLGALTPAADVTGAVVGQFERLRAAAQAGAARLVVVTGQGGALGHDGPAGDAVAVAVAGAAQGMVRTFARELPGVASRLVDVDPAEGAEAVAAHVVAELRGVGAPTEVGRTAAGRRVLSTVARPLDADAGIEAGISEDRDLGAGSVVVVTGGARGIGARLAVALARTSGCGVELIGRSPLPGPEPADLASAEDEVAVRQAIIRRGQHTRPADIEAATARALADREIRATLAALAEHAAFVDYRSLDVRDTAALAGALAAIRGERGRLDGVVHAAGVREDKLIRDKEPESFARVFDTKVGAARVIADAVGERGFAVFFASVSGWFGNAGQVDYAAANSVLDAVARHARRTAPGSRILAIDWGPWAGAGMVSPELAREYARRGIGLVDPDEGVAAALAELRAGIPDPQVVVMCASPEHLGA